MSKHTTFLDLIGRVRAGDQAAAAEVLRRFEPELRLAVSRWLTYPLRRRLDPEDVCQMVLSAFFTRASRGRYELSSPGQLLRLLKAMARNRVRQQARALRALRRGGHLRQADLAAAGDFRAPGPGPGQEVAQAELLRLFHGRLSPGECWLLEQRGLGRTWEELAAESGDQPDALRKRYRRKVARVARALGLGE
jgi:RNA polymerase sigma-70 factor (ECF subfamily)